MTRYELCYATDPIDDETENTLLDNDYFIERHEGLTLVSTDTEGRDPYQTAMQAARTLERFGVRVRRLNLDLVTRAQIASRTGVSKQAAHKWAQLPGFPAPYSNSTGLAWAWSDVNDWLIEHKPDLSDNFQTPSPRDVARFDSMWETERCATDAANLAPETVTVTWSRPARGNWSASSTTVQGLSVV